MERFFLQKNHNSTKRNYLQRMIDEKVECMKIAKKYEKQYWDGNRRYGDKKIGEFFEPITLRVASELAIKYKLPNIK